METTSRTVAVLKRVLEWLEEEEADAYRTPFWRPSELADLLGLVNDVRDLLHELERGRTDERQTQG